MHSFRQQGVTLISLMVGLLISMVALLGMMSLYSTVVQSTTQSTRDARIAGERSAALLLASRQLLGAGFGIVDTTYGKDLLLKVGGSLDTDDRLSGGTSVAIGNEGNTLIWRWISQPGEVGEKRWCGGLHVQPSSSEQAGLYMLQPQTCNTVTDPESWEVRPLLIDNSDAAGESIPITITIEDGDCSVLGIAGGGQVSVSLRTEDHSSNEIISTTCLINFTSG